MTTSNSIIQSFNFGDKVRGFVDELGQPWFLAADICKALGLTNTTKALLKLDSDESTLNTIQGKENGNSTGNYVNESGLYSLILKSRKAEAKIFKKWVTSEVLPSLRKTGRYEVGQQQPTPHPDFLMIHKSVLQDTGKALVWMGNYGVTSQPYYGGAQSPFIDGVPVNKLNDQSERYYLVRYIGNTLDSQYLATESAVTHHIHQQFPTLQVVNKNTMIENFGAIMHQLSEFSGMFSTFEESKSRFMQATAKF